MDSENVLVLMAKKMRFPLEAVVVLCTSLWGSFMGDYQVAEEILDPTADRFHVAATTSGNDEG